MNAEIKVNQALKSMARNQRIKAYLQQSPELYSLFQKAAQRFVTGEGREDGIRVAKALLSKDYSISLEYIGENTANAEESRKAKNEFVQLIEAMAAQHIQQTVSFDLSHLGLSVDPELAREHVLEMAEKATMHNIQLMISMEESSKTESILNIYKQISQQYANIGMTIQAYLNRSDSDLQELLQYPGRIRVVKGAYQEPANLALPRSAELNKRYLNLLEQLLEANKPVSIATHDRLLLEEIEQRHYARHPQVEIEMLYGVCPELLSSLKKKGYNCKVYLTYGQEWYLYLCHRLAEYPENIYRAIVDLIEPTLKESSQAY